MFPTDEWLETLNFYLITNSAGQVTIDDFSDAQLAETWQDHPGLGFADLDTAAVKLVLEFQAKRENTEAKSSPTSSPCGIGETEELPNGPVSIPMLGVPADF